MITIFSRKVILASLIFIFTNYFYAQGFSHDNFPTKEEVFTKIKSTDQKETLLKQARAFRFLLNEISLIPESKKSTKEKKLQNEYEQSLKIIREKYNNEIESLESKSSNRRYTIESDPTGDKELQNFIINNLFDEKTRNDWNEREQRIDTRNEKIAEDFVEKTEAMEKKGTNPFLLIIGIILSFNMFIIQYFIGKRRKANNDSYNMMWGKAIVKTIMTIISIGLMLVGFLLVAIAFK